LRAYGDEMPIVIVTALPADVSTVDRVLARLVADVAVASGCPLGDVWASYVPATAQHVGTRRAETGRQCPIVVIRGRARSNAAISAALAAAAHAVSAELGVSEDDVWLQWVDVMPGRAHAGGKPVGS